jgi:hypothetical protein
MIWKVILMIFEFSPKLSVHRTVLGSCYSLKGQLEKGSSPCFHPQLHAHLSNHCPRGPTSRSGRAGGWTDGGRARRRPTTPLLSVDYDPLPVVGLAGSWERHQQSQHIRTSWYVHLNMGVMYKGPAVRMFSSTYRYLTTAEYHTMGTCSVHHAVFYS